MIKKKFILKVLAVYIAFSFICEIAFPTVAFALTSGPASPDFSSFEPVATTDMVNLFNGDLTYNLPVINVPGGTAGGDYALSLSYHSGSGPEEDASWVGFGWNLNPGSLSRSLKGFPDEYKNNEVHQFNKTRINWTVSATQELGLESFSLDASIGGSATVRYNNYRGFSTSTGLNVGFKGVASLGINNNEGSVTYSASISPAQIIAGIVKKSQDVNKYMAEHAGVDKKSAKKAVRKADKEKRKDRGKDRYDSHKQAIVSKLKGKLLGSSVGLHTFYSAPVPISNHRTQGVSFNFSASVQMDGLPVPVGINSGTSGNLTIQRGVPHYEGVANGYNYPVFQDPSLSLDDYDVLNDYFVEKPAEYSKRETFIGVPFNNADNFSLSGEGIGGGFRSYLKKAGHFHPNYSGNDNTSRTFILQMGVEAHIGATIGAGVDFGVGSNVLGVNEWNSLNNSTARSFTGIDYNSNYLHRRMNNDLGGELYYSLNNEAEAADLSEVSSFDFQATIPPSIYASLNDGEPINSASTVEAHTLKEYKDLDDNDQDKELFNPGSTFINNHASHTDALAPKINYSTAIAEYKITNDAGSSYVYGLPVFSREEKTLNVGATNPTNIYNGYLAEVACIKGEEATDGEDEILKNETVTGEYQPVAYPNSHLLTQILSSQYIDADATAGPSDGDFGAWTKFDYKRAYGLGGDWYKWRSPYAGVSYSKNQISDLRDDIGSISCGQKEVFYLKAIETKTHIAYFVTNNTVNSDFGSSLAVLTGSGYDRFDGLDANDAPSNNVSWKGSNKLERLEKIVLFSKERMNVPLKVVHFEYDYSLVKNLPNNQNGSWPNPAGSSSAYNNSGKLTLKKVWFEYEGISNAKISPYVFSYEYVQPSFYSNDIATKYPDVVDFSEHFTSTSQNPDYSPYSLDMWGNHNYNGALRKANMQPWVYQGTIAGEEASVFDPAAWQLKRIQLPSGGEIHIQYEQNDYAYVHDRKAMAMVSLMPASIDGDSETNRFYLNTVDLGIPDDTSPEAIAARAKLALRIKNEYEDQEDKKIYYRFLYGLINGASPTLDNCKAEYITGYAHVSEVGIDTDRIYLELGTPGEEDAPIDACLRYVRTQKGGRLSNSNCTTIFDPIENSIYAAIYGNPATGCNNFIETGVSLSNLGDPNATPTTDENTLLGALRDVVENGIDAVTGPGIISDPNSINDIGEINHALSYLKVPMLGDKRGGGIRVKRLLTYDKGLEEGDAVLYGSEYTYKTINGESSGVATNEPAMGREENALVGFLAKNKQAFLNKLVAGEDFSDAEGPIGESILPPPSIGYSRVIVNNIHQDKTGTGYSISEFYTCKDYPFDKFYQTDDVSGPGVEMTSLAANSEKDFLNIPAGLINFKKDNKWLTQGFRFIKNNMHGKQKSVSTYGGVYGGESYLSSSQVTYYYEPGEEINLLSYEGGTYKVEPGIPGKEMDVTMEIKRLHESSIDLSLEIDFSLGIGIPPPIIVSAMPTVSFSRSEVNTHLTSKVINYPCYVKRVESYLDGAKSVTENLAFNKSNGAVLLTKTYDEFDGLALGTPSATHNGEIYTLNTPASWYYPAMGQKSISAANSNELAAEAGKISAYGANANPLKNGTSTVSSTNFNNWMTTPVGVLAASVNTFAKNWFLTSTSNVSRIAVNSEYAINTLSTSNTPAYNELNTQWLPASTYVYKSSVTSSTSTGTDRIHSGGIFSDFTPFSPSNYANNSVPNSKWIRSSNIVAYTPDGSAVEETNALAIPSSIRYGYDKQLPILTAQNAEYVCVNFYDFESTSDFSPTTSTAHTGNSSLELDGQTFFNIKVNQHVINNGLILKFWLQTTDPAIETNVTIDGGGASVAPVKVVSRNGEWVLVEANLTATNLPALNSTAGLYISKSGSYTYYIDDIRVQPSDSQMSCYVYDAASKRLIAQFDDQHFALLYQYNNEGKLVRKIVETEKGTKTIKETQYNQPKVIR